MEKYNHAMDKAVPHLESVLNGCGAGLGELGWGDLAYCRGDLPAAEEFILRALKRARLREQYEIESRAFFYLMRVYLNRGEYEKIRTIRQQINPDREKTRFLNQQVYYDLTSGWFYAQTGETHRIASWLKNEFEESDLNSIVYGLEILVKAKYHYAIKEYEAALAALKNGDDHFGPLSYLMGKIEIKILEAACHFKMGKSETCFTGLEEAWKLAEPNGFIMPFTEMSRDMAAMAASAIEWGISAIKKEDMERIRLSASAYAKRLSIIEKNNFLPGKKEIDAGASGLSRREIEVFEYLYEGLTVEEIAGEISTSINTLKSIIKRIYSKLGAWNRGNAIQIGLEQGLLKQTPPSS
jgi:LuxR family maltose regulon positive regulatory protein